jgi:hypothetical protein
MFFAGGGYGFNSVVENLHAKIQYGAGLEYGLSKCRVLNFMENTILILAIILIISKRRAR